MPATRLLIDLCWAVWVVYWIAMAFSAKPTVERGGFLGYRLVIVAVVFGLGAAWQIAKGSSHMRLWQSHLALGILSDAIVLAGVAFTVWARVALGRNWSAEVTFKRDHELIEAGPYAIVRHPIYTGLLAMGLGTVISYGRALGVILLAGICAGLWWKAREEERMMSRHFPATYEVYRARVHAIIPFVL